MPVCYYVLISLRESRQTLKVRNNMKKSPKAPKAFNNCDETEKHIIREYESWCKCDAPINYKMLMIQQWMHRAKDAGIYHLIEK
jgi:hypothetical protein